MGDNEKDSLFSSPSKHRPERATSEEISPKKPLRASSDCEFMSDPGVSRDEGTRLRKDSPELPRTGETVSASPRKIVSPLGDCDTTMDISKPSEVTLDRHKMEKLLNHLLDITEDYYLEDLESIYSSLQRITLKYMNEWNRKDLEKVCLISREIRLHT